jgi:hypothetical protein
MQPTRPGPPFDYLAPLEGAVAQIAKTWRPDDPEYRADVYPQIVMQFSYGYFARIDDDGKFRAVIALRDPGVPNWLDPAGFLQGTIYGHWYDCDSAPAPTLTRVKLDQLRDYLPPDTPRFSPQQRAAQISERVRGAQRRRRW